MMVPEIYKATFTNKISFKTGNYLINLATNNVSIEIHKLHGCKQNMDVLD
jgi:hypothetical protein